MAYPVPTDPGGYPARRRSAKPLSLHRAKPAAEKIRVAKATSGPPQPAPGLMDDGSLREGDAVMTYFGIRVFTGSSGPHHKAEDFATLSDLKRIPKQSRSVLFAIDAHRSAPGSASAEATMVTGRSAAEPQVAEGALITDPKETRSATSARDRTGCARG